MAYDGVETPHGKVDRMLGGACTYISLAASYFAKPKIVAVVGDDFAAEDEKLLSDRGIDLEGLERVKGGKTFFWAGVYSHDMNDRTTLRTDLNVFADFNPKLPESYKKSPVPAARQHSAGSAAQRARADERSPSGRRRHHELLDPGFSRDELVKTIQDWDFLLINDSEARMLSGENNLKRAAAKIMAMGPKTLVIKRGEYGAILFHGDSHFMVPGYLLEEVFDPTGAGDCFAGGFIGYLAEQGVDLKAGNVSAKEISRAVIYGSVMGSFCCEKFGVDRFRTLTRKEVDARFQEFRDFTEF